MVAAALGHCLVNFNELSDLPACFRMDFALRFQSVAATVTGPATMLQKWMSLSVHLSHRSKNWFGMPEYFKVSEKSKMIVIIDAKHNVLMR